MTTETTWTAGRAQGTQVRAMEAIGTVIITWTADRIQETQVRPMEATGTVIATTTADRPQETQARAMEATGTVITTWAADRARGTQSGQWKPQVLAVVGTETISGNQTNLKIHRRFRDIETTSTAVMAGYGRLLGQQTGHWGFKAGY